MNTQTEIIKAAAYAAEPTNEWHPDSQGVLKQAYRVFFRKIGTKEMCTYWHTDRELHERMEARLIKYGFALGRFTPINEGQSFEVTFHV